MDIKAIIRDGLMLSGQRIYGVVLDSVFSFVTAGLLGPMNYGFLSLIRMIPSVGSLLTPGWIEAATRERLHLAGSGYRKEYAFHLRNVAYSAQIFIGFGWFVLMLVYGFWSSSWNIRLAALVGGLIHIAEMYIQFIVHDITVCKNFAIIAKSPSNWMNVSSNSSKSNLIPPTNIPFTTPKDATTAPILDILVELQYSKS